METTTERPKLVPPMPRPSTSRVSVLLWTGTSASSTSRPSMSHGSQPALVPTVSLETRTTGEHTTSTDRLSSATTHANTHLNYSWRGHRVRKKCILVRDECNRRGLMHWVRVFFACLRPSLLSTSGVLRRTSNHTIMTRLVFQRILAFSCH